MTTRDLRWSLFPRSCFFSLSAIVLISILAIPSWSFASTTAGQPDLCSDAFHTPKEIATEEFEEESSYLGYQRAYMAELRLGYRFERLVRSTASFQTNFPAPLGLSYLHHILVADIFWVPSSNLYPSVSRAQVDEALSSLVHLNAYPWSDTVKLIVLQTAVFKGVGIDDIAAAFAARLDRDPDLVDAISIQTALLANRPLESFTAYKRERFRDRGYVERFSDEARINLMYQASYLLYLEPSDVRNYLSAFPDRESSYLVQVFKARSALLKAWWMRRHSSP